MHNKKRAIEKFFGLIIIFIALLLIPTIFFGGETDIRPEKSSESHVEYVLVVKGDHISLKAKDASLKDILEEIGRRMKIEVIANISREEKITIDLDMMYLGDALKRFKTNYAYITKTDKKKGKITNIVVVPEGMEKMLPNKYEYNAQRSVQNFEYNPQPPIQDFERGTQPSHVESEFDPQPSIQMFVHEPQPPIVRSEHESQSSSTTTENDTQPSNVGSDYDPQPSIIE